MADRRRDRSPPPGPGGGPVHGHGGDRPGGVRAHRRDPLALKLRRGAVTGTLGIAALASVALGRPFLIIVTEHVAKLNPQRRTEIAAKLAEPRRRRALTTLSTIIGATFTLDGATQIALALTVPTGSFVADSTAVRIAVLGTGLVLTTTYLRRGIS